MESGRSVLFMPWVDENTILKGIRCRPDEYSAEVSKWKRAEVLFIDDFFKTGKGVPVTGADVMTAYEILNYRYLQTGSITIISTERSCDEIMRIDPSVGGRIFEKSKDIMIYLGLGWDKNQRLKAHSEP